jgi:hypothetical protein
LIEPVLIGVQVGSYEGEVKPWAVDVKLKQLMSGWDHNRLSYGALVLAGKCDDEARALVTEHNRKNSDRKVKLVDGYDLARLVLRMRTGIA